MQKFEYTATVCMRTKLVEELNNFGDQGWEMVVIVPENDKVEIYFKRAKT